MLAVPLSTLGISSGAAVHVTSGQQLLAQRTTPSSGLRTLFATTPGGFVSVIAHAATPAPRIVHQVVTASRPSTRVVRPTVHHTVRPVVAPNNPSRFRVGIATWYAWHPGQCATSYRPHGTRIWVRDLATNKVISCLVTDTQPYSPTHVVDLSQYSFRQLAPLGQGVIRVKVTW